MTNVYVKIGLDMNDIQVIASGWTADTQSQFVLDDDVLDLSKIIGYVGYVGDDGQKHLKFDQDKYDAKVKEQQKQQAIMDGEKMKQELSVQMVLDNATDEQAIVMKYLYPTWSGNGIKYKKDDRLMYNDVFYKVLQDHTSQESWTPDTASSLFTVVGNPEEEYPEFIQPTGAHNAYAKGDKVTFEGKKYKSLIDNNVYSPTAYPQGWSLVE